METDRVAMPPPDEVTMAVVALYGQGTETIAYGGFAQLIADLVLIRDPGIVSDPEGRTVMLRVLTSAIAQRIQVPVGAPSSTVSPAQLHALCNPEAWLRMVGEIASGTGEAADAVPGLPCPRGPNVAGALQVATRLRNRYWLLPEVPAEVGGPEIQVLALTVAAMYGIADPGVALPTHDAFQQLIHDVCCCHYGETTVSRERTNAVAVVMLEAFDGFLTSVLLTDSALVHQPETFVALIQCWHQVLATGLVRAVTHGEAVPTPAGMIPTLRVLLERRAGGGAAGPAESAFVDGVAGKSSSTNSHDSSNNSSSSTGNHDNTDDNATDNNNNSTGGGYNSGGGGYGVDAAMNATMDAANDAMMDSPIRTMSSANPAEASAFKRELHGRIRARQGDGAHWLHGGPSLFNSGVTYMMPAEVVDDPAVAAGAMDETAARAAALNFINTQPDMRMRSVLTAGDGSCLLHALSIGMWGVHLEGSNPETGERHDGTRATAVPANTYPMGFSPMRTALIHFTWEAPEPHQLEFFRAWAGERLTVYRQLALTEEEVKVRDRLQISHNGYGVGSIGLAPQTTQAEAQETEAWLRRVDIGGYGDTGAGLQFPDAAGSVHLERGWLGAPHIFAMANVLRRPVLCYVDNEADTSIYESDSYYGGIFLPSPQFVAAEAWESRRPLLVHGGQGHFTAMLTVEGHTRHIPLFTTSVDEATGTILMKPLPVRFLRLQVPAPGTTADNANTAAPPLPPPPDGEGDTAWYYERLRHGTGPTRRRQTLLEVLLGAPITLINRGGLADLPVLALDDVPGDPPPNAHVRAIQQSFLAGLRPRAGTGDAAGESNTGDAAAPATAAAADADPAELAELAELQAAMMLSMEGALPRAEYLPGGTNSVRSRLVSANAGGGSRETSAGGLAGAEAAAAAAAIASSTPASFAARVYRAATDAVFGAADAPEQISAGPGIYTEANLGALADDDMVHVMQAFGLQVRPVTADSKPTIMQQIIAAQCRDSAGEHREMPVADILDA